MRRYHRLLAGASWMAEYGDPDDAADWEFLRDYSPYHNVRRGRPYPPVLLDHLDPRRPGAPRARPEDGRPGCGSTATTSRTTRTSRAATARAADNRQRAFVMALGLEFMWRALST